MDGRKKPGSRAADSSFMLGLAPQSGFAKHSLQGHEEARLRKAVGLFVCSLLRSTQKAGVENMLRRMGLRPDFTKAAFLYIK